MHKIKKIFVSIGVLVAGSISLCSCKGNENSKSNPQSLLTEESVTETTTTQATETTTTEAKEEATEEATTTKTTESTGSSGGLDIDLSTMTKNMVYGQVNEIMMDPEAYIGKRIKMKGIYTPSYYEDTGKYYHYCVIQDALACCSQGMEFIWVGEHNYPNDYPKEGDEIIVEGVFKKYEELGYEYYYIETEGFTEID